VYHRLCVVCGGVRGGSRAEGGWVGGELRGRRRRSGVPKQVVVCEEVAMVCEEEERDGRRKRRGYN